MFRSLGHVCTNYITPTAWTDPQQLPPPVHHLYALYIALAFPFNSHANWMTTNLVHLFVGFLALFVAIKVLYNSNSLAFYSLACLLAFPITTWLAANSLAEPIYFSYSCCFLLGVVFIRLRRFFLGLLLSLVSCSLYAGSRSDGILLIPLLLYFLNYNSRLSMYSKVFLSITSLSALWLALSSLDLSKYPTQGLKALLVQGSGDLAGSEMISFMSNTSIDFSFKFWFGKAISQLVSIFIPSGLSWFLYGLPVLGLSLFVIILIRLKKLDADKIVLLVFPFIAIIATTVTHQYQVRYWLPWLPFWFLVFPSYFLHNNMYLHSRSVLKKWFLVSVGSISFIYFLLTLVFVSKDAIASAKHIEKISSFFDGPTPCSSVLVADTLDQLPAYALMPKKLFYVDSSLNSVESIHSISRINNVCGLIVPATDSGIFSFSLNSIHPSAFVISVDIGEDYRLERTVSN